MVIAFQTYGKLSSVNVRPMTAISALSNIHEDIFTSAHQKRAAIILLPFHKHQRVDGSMESLGHSFHVINELVLSHAPCSVGILVDHGLGGTSQVQGSDVSFNVVVPYFGGRDDNEALAYGMRMAEHPGILLNVVKFVATPRKTLAFGAKLVGVSSDKGQKVAIEEIDGSSHDGKQHDDLLVGDGKQYAPTYEDKDGDWMLVGDVPWNMFMSSCKRLRIVKGSEAKGLACL